MSSEHIGQPPVPTGHEEDPRCVRHPQRVSYVRCQRCSGPTCPECQRPAAVGVHCIGCVEAAAKHAPSYVTPFGATYRPDAKPILTYTIIAICVAVQILQLVFNGNYGEMPLTNRYSLVPILIGEEPWRLLTSGFLHSTQMLLHLLVNMVMLWQLGPMLEELFGKLRFAAIYLLSLLGGSAFYLLISPPYVETASGVYPSSAVGASGAIFGLFAAVLVVLRKLRRPAKGMFIIVAVNLVLGFLIPNVAWESHVGGMIFGAMAVLALVLAPKAKRVWWQAGGLAMVAAIVVILTLFGIARTPVLTPRTPSIVPQGQTSPQPHDFSIY